MDSYSFLMAVYVKEKPEFLAKALESVFSQTVVSNDVVLVCDGPLNEELDAVISKFQIDHPDSFHVERLAENGGLGHALDVGLPLCKNEIVLRADSDDISRPERAEKQLECLQNCDICSCDIALFSEDIDLIHGYRRLPKTHEEIVSFAKRRCPFNHPATAFKKSVVLDAGGYQHFPYAEDWYLWVRMIQKGAKCLNLPDNLVYMREDQATYLRRGNKEAYKSIVKLLKYMRKTHFIRFGRYLKNRILYFGNRVMPNWLRAKLYRKMLRK